MPKPAPISADERAELRRLYLAAPGGTWEVPLAPSGPSVLYARLPGRDQVVARFEPSAGPQTGHQAALVAASARNALPRLFAEIDELRARTRGVPVLGMVR